jgi:hypothetical protein
MTKSDRDWLQIADEAAEEIGQAPHGRKESLLAAIADRLDIGVPTLRTYLLAGRFVRSLSPQLRSDAAKMPAIAVETTARWSRYDPAGAAQAISEYAAGRLSIRSLARAETAARRAGGVLSATQERRNFKAAISRELRRLVPVWPLEPHCPLQECIKVDAEDPSGEVDFMAQKMFWGMEEMPKGGELVAVLVVGPYSVQQAYDSKATDWCLRALGLTFFNHKHIALVLPQGAPSEAFVEFLARTPSADKYVQLLQDSGPAARSAARGIRRTPKAEPGR